MTLSTRQLADIDALVRDTARQVIMPLFRNLAPGSVHAKTGPQDLVTEADEAAERRITAGLRTMFPGCAVVGEEAASADPTLLTVLADADLAFVVDPIDGTYNFASGLPLFGTMIAAIARGEVIASVIHDPVGNDSALALRGEGAWIETTANNRRDLRVKPPVPVAEMAGNLSWRFLPEADRARVCANLPKVAGSWDYRCSAHEYRMLADGHCDFLFFYRLYPWDHAPGWLLHQEAGGYAAQFDGRPYNPPRIDGGLICAADRDSWRALRDTLLG
jgi:fructose-1,6-bisphosphatase/inositol monophosphatase family enzyme